MAYGSCKKNITKDIKLEDELLTCYSLLVTFYLLLVTFYLLLVSFYLLLVTFYVLLVTFYSLLIRAVLYYIHNFHIKLYGSSWKNIQTLMNAFVRSVDIVFYNLDIILLRLDFQIMTNE